MSDTHDTSKRLEASQVQVLLDAGTLRESPLDMPAELGHWTTRIGGASFELSAKGEAAAQQIAALSDGADEALALYRSTSTEQAHCLPGAFRDGFAHGAEWMRRNDASPSTSPAELHRLLNDLAWATSHEQGAPAARRAVEEYFMREVSRG